MKSTKTHLANPQSSCRKIPWELIKRLNKGAQSIHLTPEMLPSFARFFLWRIRAPFILVTGDSDLAICKDQIPEALLKTILNNRYLTRWHAQNLVYQHPKLHPIPIGLDYHTLAPDVSQLGSHVWGDRMAPTEQEEQLKQVTLKAGPLEEKKLQAYSNWHFAADRGNRQECLDQFPKDCAYYQPEPSERLQSWTTNAGYAFTISPLGNGLDCHRTWEAILLGSIPVVKTSPIDGLYRDLPVVILEKWSDFTPDRMASEFERIKDAKYDFSRLELSYWQTVLRDGAAPKTVLSTFRQFRETL